LDATGGYAVEPEGGERLEFGGGTVLIKAATPAFTVWEELPPLLDTPLHVHAHEDELFHILDGEHVFECGGDRFESALATFLPFLVACRMRTGVWCEEPVGSS
jgi:hypothetical protein